MAISRISSATAEATTVTMPTHATGDLLLMFAYRDGSTTTPLLAAGWTNIDNGGANTNSSRLAYKVAASGSETSGTWTNATNLTVHVYRGQSTTRPVGVAVRSSGSSATVSFGGVTMLNNDGTSWVAGFVGHRSVDTTTIANPPSTMANVNSLLGATADMASHDTNAGVTGFSTGTVATGGTASGYMTHTVEILNSTYSEYTANGTWTAPANGTVKIKAWGGGGAGRADTNVGGGGGGGGAFAQKNSLSVTNATGYTVTVGAGGTVAAAPANGTAGGDSWFSTSGTVLAKGGSGGTTTTGATGGASGSCIGDTVFSGGNGGSISAGAGGGGGGGAGDAAVGGNSTTVTGGTGGANGGGAGGIGGSGGNAGDGVAPGGGGGGSDDFTGDLAGAGAVGKVAVIFTAGAAGAIVNKIFRLNQSINRASTF